MAQNVIFDKFEGIISYAYKLNWNDMPFPPSPELMKEFEAFEKEYPETVTESFHSFEELLTKLTPEYVMELEKRKNFASNMKVDCIILFGEDSTTGEHFHLRFSNDSLNNFVYLFN